jgi:dienelactone hydrolase
MTKPHIKALMLGIALSATEALSQQALPTNWVGGSNVLGNWQFAQARIENVSGSLSGSIDIPTLNAMYLPIDGTLSNGDALHFHISSPLGQLDFNGTLRDGVVDGKITGANAVSGSLHLVPAATLDAALFKRYVGTYRLGDGTTLDVTYRPFGQLRANQYDVKDGVTAIKRSLFLIPRDDSTFFTSGSIVSAPKRDEVIRFAASTGGPSATLEWNRPGAPAERGTRADDMRQEWVVIRNGGITLNGTLFTPLSGGPFPAIVSMGGSGPTTRDGVAWRAREFVRTGLAVLILDKRGTGDPSGSWNTSTIQEFATDAEAGLRWMRARNDIDPRRIGIHGQSQGGWVAMTLLASDTIAKFAILTSSTPLAPAGQEVYRAGAQARGAGLPETEAVAASELMRLKWRFALTGDGWDQLSAAVTAAKGKPWLAAIGVPPTRDSDIWNDMRAFKGFDPMQYASRLRVPALLIFGSADNEVPPTPSQELWRTALKAAANNSATIVELPGLEHGLFLKSVNGRTTLMKEVGDTVAKWLSQTLPALR